jgi:hypothetical protein
MWVIKVAESSATIAKEGVNLWRQQSRRYSRFRSLFHLKILCK